MGLLTSPGFSFLGQKMNENRFFSVKCPYFDFPATLRCWILGLQMTHCL